MQSAKFLYEDNRKFLSKTIPSVAHPQEMWRNIFYQCLGTRRKITLQSFITAFGIACLGGLTGYASLKGFFDAVQYFLLYMIMKPGTVWLHIGILLLSFLGFFFTYLIIRFAMVTLSALSMDDAAKLSDVLLSEYQITSGKIIKVNPEGAWKRIFYSYAKPGQPEIEAQFATLTQIPLVTGDDVIVIYNDHFSVLL